MEEISKYSITYFLNLEDSAKKIMSVDHNLQILDINKDLKGNFYLTLSDSLHFYDGFIFLKKREINFDFVIFQIIKLESILPIHDRNNEKTFSIIKLKNVDDKVGYMIGNPEHYYTRKIFNEHVGRNFQYTSGSKDYNLNDNSNISEDKLPITLTHFKRINSIVNKSEEMKNINTIRRVKYEDSLDISNLSPIANDDENEKTADFLYHTFDSFKKSKSKEKLKKSLNSQKSEEKEKEKTKENQPDRNDQKYSILNSRERGRVNNINLNFYNNKNNGKLDSSGMIEFNDENEDKESAKLRDNIKIEEDVKLNFDIPKNKIIKINRNSADNRFYVNERKNQEPKIRNSNLQDLRKDNIVNRTYLEIQDRKELKSPVVIPRTSVSAKPIQPDNQKIKMVSISVPKKPQTTAKKYFYSINMLTDLINSFHLLGKVVDILNYTNTTTLIIKDIENSYAKVVLNYKHKEIFKDKIKLNRVYIFSNGEVEDVRFRNARINNKSIKFVIKLNYSSNIEEYNENQEIIESDVSNKLITLPQLQDYYIRNEFIIDIIVYVLNINKDKENTQYYNSKLICTDDSNMTIEISLIKSLSEKEIKYGDILWIRNAIITFSTGYSLLTSPISLIDINPDIIYDKVVAMKNHCENYIGRYIVHNDVYKSHIGLKYDFIREVLKDMNGNLYAFSEFSYKIIKARIVSFTHDKKNTYLACPICRKALKQELKTPFKCESCNKYFTSPKYCYCFSIKVADCSGSSDLILFDELGEKLFRIDAVKYTSAIYNNDTAIIKRLNKQKNEMIYKDFYFLIKPRIRIFKQEYKELTVINYEEIFSINQIKNESRGLIKKFYNN
jgi:hypothetical protein